MIGTESETLGITRYEDASEKRDEEIRDIMDCYNVNKTSSAVECPKQ